MEHLLNACGGILVVHQVSCVLENEDSLGILVLRHVDDLVKCQWMYICVVLRILKGLTSLVSVEQALCE